VSGGRAGVTARRATSRSHGSPGAGSGSPRPSRGRTAVELASRRAGPRSGRAIDLALTQADQVLSVAGQASTAHLAQAGGRRRRPRPSRHARPRAAVYRFLGARMGQEAVPAFIGTGALDEAGARPSLADQPRRYRGAEELMARPRTFGDRVADGALSELPGPRSAESSHRAALPDTPAALAARRCAVR
jgi:hypothetical protein